MLIFTTEIGATNTPANGSATYDVDQSLSRKANCYDNALVESFWATLKTECFDDFCCGILATRQEARQKLSAYIEAFYNGNACIPHWIINTE